MPLPSLAHKNFLHDPLHAFPPSASWKYMPRVTLEATRKIVEPQGRLLAWINNGEAQSTPTPPLSLTELYVRKKLIPIMLSHFLFFFLTSLLEYNCFTMVC